MLETMNWFFIFISETRWVAEKLMRRCNVRVIIKHWLTEVLVFYKFYISLTLAYIFVKSGCRILSGGQLNLLANPISDLSVKSVKLRQILHTSLDVLSCWVRPSRFLVLANLQIFVWIKLKQDFVKSFRIEWSIYSLNFKYWAISRFFGSAN